MSKFLSDFKLLLFLILIMNSVVPLTICLLSFQRKGASIDFSRQDVDQTSISYFQAWHGHHSLAINLSMSGWCLYVPPNTITRHFYTYTWKKDAERYPQLTETPSCFPWGLPLNFWNWNNHHQVRSIQNIGKLR